MSAGAAKSLVDSSSALLIPQAVMCVFEIYNEDFFVGVKEEGDVGERRCVDATWEGFDIVSDVMAGEWSQSVSGMDYMVFNVQMVWSAEFASMSGRLDASVLSRTHFLRRVLMVFILDGRDACQIVYRWMQL